MEVVAKPKDDRRFVNDTMKDRLFLCRTEWLAIDPIGKAVEGEKE